MEPGFQDVFEVRLARDQRPVCGTAIYGERHVLRNETARHNARQPVQCRAEGKGTVARVAADGHIVRMSARYFLETAVHAQRRHAVLDSRGIQEVEQLPFGGGFDDGVRCPLIKLDDNRSAAGIRRLRQGGRDGGA